ncbi:MAG: homocysteine S-methyltransferase family protein [Ignavibacteria bacterium]|nr:homocysteine S-methyltransferase family protein [Ignavibacteria bacterium]
MGALNDLLDTGRTVILDSAMGTELMARGSDVSLPLWSAKALIDRPDLIRHIHIDNIDTGADIVTANTFRTQRRTFEKAGYQYKDMSYADTARHFTQDAVDLAKDAVMIASDEDTAPVLVAGCIAPLEDSYRPDLTPDTDTLSTEHNEHIKNLVDAGCDLLLAETLTNIREISAVLNQLHTSGLDYIISFTPRNDKELFSGEPISEAMSIINKFSPSAVSVNCIHPFLVEHVVNHLKQLTDLPLCAYANIGDPNYKEGDPMRKTVSPDDYFNFAKRWKSLGVRIIGGCCGTNPMYVRKLSLLKEHKHKK